MYQKLSIIHIASYIYLCAPCNSPGKLDENTSTVIPSQQRLKMEAVKGDEVKDQKEKGYECITKVLIRILIQHSSL